MKKKTLFLLCLFMSLLFVGCSGKKDVVSQTQSEMKKQADSYSLRKDKLVGNKTSIEGELKFDGRISIAFFSVSKESKIKIDYEITTKKGDFQMILTDNRDYFEKICSLGKKDKVEDVKELNLKEGVYRLKVIGNSANTNLNLNFDYEKEDISLEELNYQDLLDMGSNWDIKDYLDEWNL